MTKKREPQSILSWALDCHTTDKIKTRAGYVEGRYPADSKTQAITVIPVVFELSRFNWRDKS